MQRCLIDKKVAFQDTLVLEITKINRAPRSFNNKTKATKIMGFFFNFHKKMSFLADVTSDC